MADKSFGVKELNIVGDGNPSISSPINLNLNAANVAISTNITIGGKVNSNLTVGNGCSVTAPNFYGDGSGLTNIVGLSPDADNNLFAGTCAGGNYDPSDGSILSCYNIFLGSCAGKCIAGGDNNIFMGCETGWNTNTGCDNIFMGQYAGRGSSQGLSGNRNISLGYNSGKSLRTGNYNNFIGAGAGRQTNIGYGNNFLGYYAGNNNDEGNRNIAVGSYAGRYVSSGSNNVFLGSYAGSTVTSGSNNVAIGKSIQIPTAVGDNQLIVGIGSTAWIRGDSSFNIYDKDGNQINGNIGIGLTSRQNLVGSTSSTHADDANENITIQVYKSYSLLKLNVSHPAWVRIYPTTAARTADSSRTISEDPTPGSGVIAQSITTTTNEDVLFTPASIGFNDDSTPSTNAYLAIMNKTGGVQSITVTMTAIKLEA